MFTCETDSKKKKSKPSEKDLDSSVLNTYHVSGLEVECAEEKKKAPFYFLLDNVLYGPAVKVRVSPCITSLEQPLFVPLMSFAPLDFMS